MSLLYAPLIKSILVLLGFGLVITWPRDLWESLRSEAVPYYVVLPILLVWLGIVIVVRHFFIQNARQMALTNTGKANESYPRLAQSMSRVLEAYSRNRGVMAGEGMICCLNTSVPQAELLVSHGNAKSPLVITQGERPVIVFPDSLIEQLSDDELDGALAHEYAHFQLRNPSWCSSEAMQYLTPISPMARLLSTQLSMEEEKACDDMAVRILGKPDVYAEMLLKSYRFSQLKGNRVSRFVEWLPQVTGGKPIIYERIERLLHSHTISRGMRFQYLMACLSWFAIIAIFGFQ